MKCTRSSSSSHSYLVVDYHEEQTCNYNELRYSTGVVVLVQQKDSTNSSKRSKTSSDVDVTSKR